MVTVPIVRAMTSQRCQVKVTRNSKEQDGCQEPHHTQHGDPQHGDPNRVLTGLTEFIPSQLRHNIIIKEGAALFETIRSKFY